MFAVDQRFVGLCPAKDVGEYHGEDELQIILRQIQDNDCTAEFARNCKLRQKRRGGKKKDKKKMKELKDRWKNGVRYFIA
jgi:hypothetical protein